MNRGIGGAGNRRKKSGKSNLSDSPRLRCCIVLALGFRSYAYFSLFKSVVFLYPNPLYGCTGAKEGYVA